jgi:hypothetical protein
MSSGLFHNDDNTPIAFNTIKAKERELGKIIHLSVSQKWMIYYFLRAHLGFRDK